MEKTGWKGIPHVEWFKVAVAAILLLVGGIVNYAYGIYNSKEPHLSYRVNETVSFQSDKNLISIATFTVTSDGSKGVENVRCWFDTPGIEDVQIFPSDLHAKKEKEPNGTGMEISVERMIPGEELQVSIYVKNIVPPKLLQVKVKSDTILGSNRPLIKTTVSPVWISVTIIELMFIVGIMLNVIRDMIRENKVRNKVHIEQQKDFDVLRAKIDKQMADIYKREAEPTLFTAK